jgi:ABC-type glycerol-3-phosphate transport system substrate-binding protein
MKKFFLVSGLIMMTVISAPIFAAGGGQKAGDDGRKHLVLYTYRTGIEKEYRVKPAEEFSKADPGFSIEVVAAPEPQAFDVFFEI